MKLSLSLIITHSLASTLYELQYEHTGATSEECERIKEKGHALLEAMTEHPDLDTDRLYENLSGFERAIRECAMETESLNCLHGLLNVCLDIHMEEQSQFGVLDDEET